MKFSLEVELEDTEYCTGCPCLFEVEIEHCGATKDDLETEWMDKGYRFIRPEGCPLREVTEK